MSEDWDLFAVVRSCSSSSFSTNDFNFKQQQHPPPPPLFTHIIGEENIDIKESLSSCNELQDSCKPFLPTTLSSPLIVSSASPPPPNNVLMKQEQELIIKPLDLVGVRSFTTTTMSPSSSSSSSMFVFKSQRDQYQQSQAPLRSRKRKNQQKKTISHVTQENLSCDMWAWRKYGQKPIKGSPYPRNYYRCSSLKGCIARKQVERSNKDQNMFIVTYTGEHTHPLPTHRNSLAGSTRNKSQPVKPVSKPDKPVKEEDIIHLSPTTPLKRNDVEVGKEEVNNNMMEEEEEDDDVEDVLIPNLTVRDGDDDLFLGGDFLSWSSGSAGDGGG
ncbi:unnamed protein product [Cochlearia groenlandica]